MTSRQIGRDNTDCLENRKLTPNGSVSTLDRETAGFLIMRFLARLENDVADKRSAMRPSRLVEQSSQCCLEFQQTIVCPFRAKTQNRLRNL